MSDQDRFMSAKSVQEFFDISSSEFYRLKKDGRIPKEHYPISPNSPRYLRSEIIASIHQGNHSTTS